MVTLQDHILAQVKFLVKPTLNQDHGKGGWLFKSQDQMLDQADSEGINRLH